MLINTAGGLTGGDHLQWQARAASGGAMVLTTQACRADIPLHGRGSAGSTPGSKSARTAISTGCRRRPSCSVPAGLTARSRSIWRRSPP
ncbi:urease accessory protein UreD [Devosia ginsengisoli]|uniref:urease accessory protein UreD n=1 Tax=Devosia ginsengisoli TaxID=400770 RepID=UPI0026E9D8BD|nr:urease accessory protein UreD [Devosia ginsengisoli]MCR6674001.1 urease accessory protein UreD [Devosia ginsengisoli]